MTLLLYKLNITIPHIVLIDAQCGRGTSSVCLSVASLREDDVSEQWACPYYWPLFVDKRQLMPLFWRYN